ncbi:MAG: sigma-70 family RNA polymerase sigma factor [Planctomycetota bacterium]|nr:sigma-70 family RNA polymerase sigma factor [Planctomycetota bacterium]
MESGITVKQPSKIDWQAALEKHQRWLWAIVYARVGEPQAVEEVLQEVALAAVRQSAPIEDEAKVAPWLYRVAIRQSLLYRRKMGRIRKLNDRYAVREQPTELDRKQASPLDWLLADERKELIRRAMEQLREKDREILLLKYSENWNYYQIADHLGVSHSAVEARLHRARARLRSELRSLQVIEDSE